ncbi:hypothetical protein O9993_17120 [Vibrio lentus]|nr:hypothetical protein [Vibrio lentus]
MNGIANEMLDAMLSLLVFLTNSTFDITQKFYLCVIDSDHKEAILID